MVGEEKSEKNKKPRSVRKREAAKPKVLLLASEDDDDDDGVGQVDVQEEEDMEDFGKEEERVNNIRASLLSWYYQNQRVFPWRTKTTGNEEKDQQLEESEKGTTSTTSELAYGVWVSEIMLQQTRVTTVIDYYNRWMQKWPTIHHLARASQEEVNDMWAGLGYYRRARFLLEGAKMVVQGLGSEFPTTVSALRKVRGIGEYTAGAIASIAFNQAVPVVDGNVIRVLARLKTISANPKASATIKTFWKLAGQLVDPRRPGDFNQALMELGATICTPSSPGCSVCPISGQCRAFSLSKDHNSVIVTDYPTRVPKTKQRLEFCAVCVVEILDDQCPDTPRGTHRNNVFLLVKRPDEGLLAGLWEFPSVLMDGEADSTVRRQAIDQYLEKSFKLDTKKTCTIFSRNHVGECMHIFSHIRLRMYVELLILRLKGGASFLYGKEEAWKCVDSHSIQGIGLTSGVRKVYNMVQQFKQNRSSLKSSSRKRKKI